MLLTTILGLFLAQPLESSCCYHRHHLECIVNTDPMSSPGDCQHPHHLACNGWTIEEVLDQIEKVSIAPIKTDVVYIKIDPILKREEIRSGKLIFRMDGDKKEVAIVFDTLLIGQRKETKKKHYIFSGRWFVEIDPEKKQFIKRELTSPNDATAINPFDLGAGPIPLPIGQKKESVLSKFNVQFTSRPTSGLLSTLKEPFIALELIPQAESDWETIYLFYNPVTWLPVGVSTIETDGTKRMSLLSNMSDSLAEIDLALLEIETPNSADWSIDIQPFVPD